MLESQKKRDNKIDEILEMTIENLKIFDEALAHRKDFSNCNESKVQSCLENFKESLSNRKLVVDDLIRLNPVEIDND